MTDKLVSRHTSFHFSCHHHLIMPSSIFCVKLLCVVLVSEYSPFCLHAVSQSSELRRRSTPCKWNFPASQNRVTRDVPIFDYRDAPLTTQSRLLNCSEDVSAPRYAPLWYRLSLGIHPNLSLEQQSPGVWFFLPGGMTSVSAINVLLSVGWSWPAHRHSFSISFQRDTARY